MTTYTKQAPQWVIDDPDKLGDAQRGLAAAGITAELSLRSDGTILIDTETPETVLTAALRDLAPVLRPEQQADMSDRDILRAYRANTSPTNAQSVAAIKSLIDVVERLVRR
jgi:hypothetical protein